MKTNMGIADRALRIILAIVVAVLIYTGTLTGAVAVVLGIIAGVFLLTALMGFCGLYPLLGINTCKKSSK